MDEYCEYTPQMGQSYSVLNWPISMSGPKGLGPTLWPIAGLCGQMGQSQAILGPHALQRLHVGLLWDHFACPQ